MQRYVFFKSESGYAIVNVQAASIQNNGQHFCIVHAFY